MRAPGPVLWRGSPVPAPRAPVSPLGLHAGPQLVQERCLLRLVLRTQAWSSRLAGPLPGVYAGQDQPRAQEVVPRPEEEKESHTAPGKGLGPSLVDSATLQTFWLCSGE